MHPITLLAYARMHHLNKHLPFIGSTKVRTPNMHVAAIDHLLHTSYLFDYLRTRSNVQRHLRKIALVENWHR